MSEPTRIYLGPVYAGIALGYRIYDITMRPVGPFTTVGVLEVLPGQFVITEGINKPVGGGYIIFGTKEYDISVHPLESDLTYPDYSSTLQLILTAISNLNLSPEITVTADVAEFNTQIAQIKPLLIAAFGELTQLHTDRFDTLGNKVVEMVGVINRLSKLDQVITTIDKVRELTKVINSLNDVVETVKEPVKEIVVVEDTQRIEAYQNFINKLEEAIQNGRVD